jgi:hypothetical protein
MRHWPKPDSGSPRWQLEMMIFQLPKVNLMQTRTLKQVINSIPTTDGGGVKLRRSLGQSQALRLDPFLMLDEFSSMNADDYFGLTCPPGKK